MTAALEIGERRSGAGHFWYGCALVLAAGLVLSLGVFAIRSAPQSDALQYLFWRAVGFTLALSIAAWLRDHRSPLAQVIGLGRFGWLAAIMMTVSQITFVSSIKLVTFAESFFLCSLAPLMAAVLARPLLGERMGWLGGVAIVMALLGVYAMTGGGGFADGIGTGGALALVSALSFALYTLATRGSPAGDRDAALILVGLATMAATSALLTVRGMPLVATPVEAAIGVAHGALVLSTGLFLFGQGSRYIPAMTFVMLAQAEAVISPIWGYLFFNENPGIGVIAGGALILAAVVIQAVDGARNVTAARRMP